MWVCFKVFGVILGFSGFPKYFEICFFFSSFGVWFSEVLIIYLINWVRKSCDWSWWLPWMQVASVTWLNWGGTLSEQKSDFSLTGAPGLVSMEATAPLAFQAIFWRYTSPPTRLILLFCSYLLQTKIRVLIAVNY